MRMSSGLDCDEGDAATAGYSAPIVVACPMPSITTTRAQLMPARASRAFPGMGPVCIRLCAAVALLAALPTTGQAQATPPAPDEARIFIDVNVAGASSSLARDREYKSLFLAFGELASTEVTYPRPASTGLTPILDLGGGFMLNRLLGIGVGFSRTTYHDAAATIAGTMPHPTVLDAPASFEGVTDGPLRREEQAVHLFIALVPLRTARSEVRLVAGPSHLWYTADMVRDVSVVQTFDPTLPQQVVTLAGAASDEVRAATLGFHVGGDYAYGITARLAITGGVRVSWGTVTVDREPLSSLEQRIRVGGTRVFLGVRIRPGG